MLREAGEAAAPRDPATAARLFGGALRLLAPDAPVEERVALLGAQAQAHMAAGQFFDAYAAWLEALERMQSAPLAARVGLIAACAALENLLGEHAKAHHRLMTALDATSGDAIAGSGLAADRAGDRRALPHRLPDRRAVGEAGTRGCAHAAGRAAGGRRRRRVRARAGASAGRFDEAREAAFEGALRTDGLRDEELADCLDHAADALAARRAEARAPRRR